MVLQNVRLAKAALRPGAGNMVNAILRKLVLLKVLISVQERNNQVITLRDSLSLALDLQENNSLPLPKLEGDDRAQARALATLYSHPVVSA